MSKLSKRIPEYPHSDWEVYKRLLTYVRRYWYIFIIAATASALYSAIDASMIRLLKPLIDDGFVAQDPAVIKMIPIVLPLIFIARGLMNFSSEYSLNWLSRRIVTCVRQELFNHYIKLPACFYDKHSSGELLSKLTFNVEQIAKATTDAILDSVRNGFLAIFLIGVMISISWKLTAWFFIAAPVIYALFSIASYRFRKYSHRIQRSMANVTHVAEENITGYKEVRIFGGEEQEIKSFENVTEKNRKLEMSLAITKAISVPLIQIVGGCALSLTLYIATQHTHAIEITAGGFATFATAMLALLKPIKELTSVNSKIQRGIAGAQSIFTVLDLPKEEDHGTYTLNRAQGDIRIENVSFRYNEDHPLALNNVSLHINPNEKVALVGQSGSGKTTLISLLPRLYDSYDGKIFLDNLNIRDLRLSSLRRQFAIVSQDVTLFNDTIANNIAYGEHDIDLEKIKKAAEAAYLMDFVQHLPHGLNTWVGDDGVLLSGGQRQRVAIARAIYKDAPILIMDEATSALDSVTEKQIQKALENLMLNRTTVVIAHRLSTIENADKIIVMDKGQIVEVGTHRKLIEQDGLYARLHRIQFQYEQNQGAVA